MSKDYYKTLGLERGASEADIKKAFRRAAAKYHPDQATGDKAEAEAKFKEVSEAYETLSDPQKKAQYDQFGSAGAGFGGGGQGGFGGGGFDFSGGGFGGDFGDIFEQFFGGQAGGRSRGPRGPARGDDIQARIQISFEDAIFGTTAEFSLDRALKCDNCNGKGGEKGSKISTCKTCHGTGEVTITRQAIFGAMRHTTVCPDCDGSGKTFEKKCHVCHGAGRARKTEKVKVKIPAGIDHGATIRLAGAGEAGVRDGPAGDLFVQVLVKESKKFSRRGADISSLQEIAIPQAVLGDEIRVETAHGEVKLKIPAGTQSGQVFKVESYGAPKVGSDKKGDHFVKINITTPKKLSKKEKELYAALAEEAGMKPKKSGLFG